MKFHVLKNKFQEKAENNLLLFFGNVSELKETAFVTFLHVRRILAGSMRDLSESFHVHLHLL